MSAAEDDAIRRLVVLFADPQPGLVTWRSAVAAAVRDAGITRAAVLEEREACAKTADNHFVRCGSMSAGYSIRARSGP